MNEERWKQLIHQAEQCEKSYREFVENTKTLSQLSGRETLWILERILLPSPKDMQSVHAVEFITIQIDWIQRQWEHERKKLEKENLLKKLGLTDEQKSILGI